jgi:hypothetical protein
MTVEVQAIRGPLDDDRLEWVTRLYGVVDAKYASLDFARHQFVDNEFGWSVHSFALDDGVPVGHTAIVPFRARCGDRFVTAGKIEAVVVAESHRGRRTAAGKSIALEVLQTAYAGGHEHGVDVLFGLAPPRVAAIHARAGCRRVSVPAETWVLLSHPRLAAREWERKRRIAAIVLSAAQQAILGAAYVLARIANLGLGHARVESPVATDVELAVAADVPAPRWTISGADAFDWYTSSGLLHAVEIGGPFGARALVLVGAPRTSVQIVAWRPRRRGLLPAILLLGSGLRIARGLGAPMLRFQPWQGSGGDGSLATACKLLGFARRPETELVIHDGEPPLGAEVELTPFFYVTF